LNAGDGRGGAIATYLANLTSWNSNLDGNRAVGGADSSGTGARGQGGASTGYRRIAAITITNSTLVNNRAVGGQWHNSGRRQGGHLGTNYATFLSLPFSPTRLPAVYTFASCRTMIFFRDTHGYPEAKVYYRWQSCWRNG